jgi:pyruvate kinase
VIRSCLQELSVLRDDMLRAEQSQQTLIRGVHPDRTASARNLVHYLAFRRHDVRPLQKQLAALGVSSLGRLEPHALSSIDAVTRLLDAWSTRESEERAPGDADFDWGDHVLREQAERLLGPSPPERGVRIMVTMPAEAADDYQLVHELVRAGMNCMRINCAHGTREEWARMVEHVRRAERALKADCRVLMDLAGAKLRTGPVLPGPAVVKVRPTRDQLGRVTVPARVWLTAQSAPEPPPAPCTALLPVSDDWLAQLAAGDRVKFVDARSAKRTLRVTSVGAGGAWAELERTAYIIPGTVLRRRSALDRDPETVVGDLPQLEGAIHLDTGDALVLTRHAWPGRPAEHDAAGRVVTPATIGCTLPQVFDDVRAGEPIWLDDGRFGGTIERVTHERLFVRITYAPPGGGRLGGDKGINLPESPLRVPALTEKDLNDLPFVVDHADIVGLSFANTAGDVEVLQQQIARLGPRRPAIMLKIETRRGFEHLPEMLLAAMKMPTCGVMIARGDLAVECGFERLAEVQEEILWICEAAHVPVVWATQVLETLAKNGMPSRAEITDAAMGHRAECVMLNKGPHVVSAVRTLADILTRMEAHQFKKRSMLRELHLAHAL